ncbi:hypothetical protein BKA64DRAFT_580406 [Cadophora sp. MPI-SDFR-AT-0126]|nr:hypothetical protein BKA64DRAFT_580406 [Leotiomycetes sp. MPI-SDFR-AT-0126]
MNTVKNTVKNSANSTNGANGHIIRSNDACTDPRPYNFNYVVISGGVSGLLTGGCLESLGLNYVVLDRNKQEGDSWKTRYGLVRRKYLGPCNT